MSDVDVTRVGKTAVVTINRPKVLNALNTQTLDELKYNLTQPGFLANYVASKWSYGEHPTGGTPASITASAANWSRSAWASMTWE